MSIRIVIGLVLIGAMSGNLLAEEAIVRNLQIARMSKEAGRFPEAIRRLRMVIEDWPDDAVDTPRAHLLLAETLIEAKRFDEAHQELRAIGERYRGREQLMAQAEELGRILRDRNEQRVAEEERAHALAERFEALERELKARGLSGEELERAFSAEKKRIEVERRFAAAREQYERVRRLWEEQGVSPEQIRERAEEIKAMRARLAEQRADLERITRRLDKAGASPAAIDGEIEELRRAQAEANRGPWRERHDDEMRELRREFIHLAEELGIPGEAAERLLQAHRKERRSLDFDEEHGREQEQDHIFHRFAEMEKRFEEMAMHMERFAQHLEMRNAEMGQTIERLVDRVEELQLRVEQLSRHREKEHDED